MSEDLYELGLEGLNVLTNKYHDKIYDWLPSLPGQRNKLNNNGSNSQPPQVRGRSENMRCPEEYSASLRLDQERSKEYEHWKPHHSEDFSVENKSEYVTRGYIPEDYQRQAQSLPDGPMLYSTSTKYYEPLEMMYKARDPPSIYRSSYSDIDTVQREIGNVKHYQHRQQRSCSPPRTYIRSYGRSRSRSRANMGTGIAGALAGGIIGNRVSKGDAFTVVASAIIGAVGANQVERIYDKHKEKTLEPRRGRRRYRSLSRSDER